MERKTVSGIMIALLLISMALMVNLPITKASGTIYIRADGSIDPSTAPIQRDGDIYTLTGNITSDTDGIVIERDNMTLDGKGYSIQGAKVAYSIGIYLIERTNVTIRNTRIEKFDYGIELLRSSNNTISENNVTDNHTGGICFEESSDNSIAGNNVTKSVSYGIWLLDSSNNRITKNDIRNGKYDGIFLYYHSVDNSITENNITSNGNWAIYLFYCSDNNTISKNNVILNAGTIYLYESCFTNRIYHNNFVNNTEPVVASNLANIWDDGYPSGGNYWSGYTGGDLCRGQYQNETGSDAIGDMPYIIDVNNQDGYPLMGLFGGLTTEGKNSTAFPSDDLCLIFENVTIGGLTTVNKTETGPEPPHGFKLAEQYYNIETTANYTGIIKIRIIYDDSNMTPEEENSLQLLQWNETSQQWMDITTLLDTKSNVICGETVHLCTFAIMMAKAFAVSGGSRVPLLV